LIHKYLIKALYIFAATPAAQKPFHKRGGKGHADIENDPKLLDKYRNTISYYCVIVKF